MTFALPINWLGNKVQTTQATHLPQDLQNSIKEGNAVNVQALVSQGLDVNQPLPNGEMPLHFAVCKNQPEVAKALLILGADPQAKDSQNLSAIDHTVLMKNDTMLTLIVSQKVARDLKGVQEQITCKHSFSLVTKLNETIQKTVAVDAQKLTPLAKAAYTGNFAHLDLFATKQNVNEFDANGFSPIHYAILAKRSDVVAKLIELGSDIKMTTKSGESLLHFAAMTGSSQILTALMDKGADVHQKNTKGQTALHFAAARENLKFIETFIKAGSNPNQVDNQGMSALSYIGTNAYQRDPLTLSKTQVVLFAAAVLNLASSTALAGGWAVSPEAQIAVSLTVIGATVAMDWSEFALLLGNLNKNWKKVLAWVGFLGLSAIPPLNVGFQAWRTYHVASNAFQGLKKCWKNGSYRPLTSARNVVVHSTNAGASGYKLYGTCMTTYEIALNVPHWIKLAIAKYNDDEDAFFEAYMEYLEFLKHRYKIGDDIIDASQCPQVTPSAFNGLGNVERIRHKNLNPQCPEHALIMMHPSLTMDDLKTQGAAAYRGYFKELMKKEVHPDKAGDSPEIQEAAVRLNAAHSTLKQWLASNS